MATPKEIAEAEKKLKAQLRKLRQAKKGLPTDGSVVETQAAVAKHFNVERSTVHTWVAKGMPGEPGHYVIADIDKWRKEKQDEDALLSGDSPALERYREAKAKLAELEYLERCRNFLSRDATLDLLNQWAAVIRRLADRLGKRYGAEATELVNDAIDDCERIAQSIRLGDDG